MSHPLSKISLQQFILKKLHIILEIKYDAEKFLYSLFLLEKKPLVLKKATHPGHMKPVGRERTNCAVYI